MPATTESSTESSKRLDEELAGLDALETAVEIPRRRGTRLWSATWPKLAAVSLALFVWQCVVWTGWKDEFILPSPPTTFAALWDSIADGSMFEAVRTTMWRAVYGFALAVIIGVLLGSAVARVRVLRAALGSMITGLQTMPSIAWFPLAIVLFQFSERAITFVVVLGAAPAIANGLIAGADNIPPLLLRAGRVLGARGLSAFRYVILPASLPSFVGGLKQGWAFAWRSLMAGDVLNVVQGKPSVGFKLDQARQLADYPDMMATMIVILAVGIVIDALFFGTIERGIRRRWGLIENR